MKSLRKIMLMAVTTGFLFHGSVCSGQNPPTAPQNPAAPAVAGQAPAPAQSQQRINVTVSVVQVPVTVKDSRGNLVADLKRDEFRVFEDGVEQQIQRLNTESMPISMVVLIDNDLKQKDEQQVEPSLVSIVGGLAPNDEAYVARFDQFFHEGKGFTKDQDALVTQLRRTVLSSRTSAPPPGDPFNGPTINNIPAPGAPDTAANGSMVALKGQPTKALDDAVYNAALLLKDRDPLKRRKIILLITDGQNGTKFNQYKYPVVKEELLKQGITVYCVATGSAYFDRKFSHLVEYAHDTGGDIFYGASQDSFSEFYSRISEEARNQYVLIYSPRGDRKVDYHSIEVRVRRSGLTVLARDGYYGGTFSTMPQK